MTLPNVPAKEQCLVADPPKAQSLKALEFADLRSYFAKLSLAHRQLQGFCSQGKEACVDPSGRTAHNPEDQQVVHHHALSCMRDLSAARRALQLCFALHCWVDLVQRQHCSRNHWFKKLSRSAAAHIYIYIYI